jgi:hypothetical protein
MTIMSAIFINRHFHLILSVCLIPICQGQEGFGAASIHEVYPKDGIDHHWFGSSVSVDNDIALIGAPGDSQYSKYGNAYIFRLINDKWHQVDILAPAIPSIDDGFGSAVSINFHYAIIGAYRQ